MKLNKILFLIFIVNICFTLNTMSQTERFDKSRHQLALRNYTSTANYFGVLTNRLDVTAGSPFNNKDNPQIDSVILNKATSEGDEIIKYFYTYDSLGNVITDIKENHRKILLTYDEFGKPTTTIYMLWKDNSWQNFLYTTYSYDSAGNILLLSDQRWKDSDWIIDRRVKYFYNSNGHRTSLLWEDWDGTQWTNYFRETRDYDSNLYLASTLYENWSGSDWDANTWRNNYFYDTLGNLILTLNENLVDNQWENGFRYIEEYDSNGDKITWLYEVWENYNWVGRTKVSHSLKKRKLTSTFYETFENGKWKNYLYIKYYYNNELELYSAKTEQWNGDSWIPGNGSMFIYDVDGNFRGYFGQEVEIHYASLTNVKDEELHNTRYLLSQNYPNPFNPSTTIRYSIPHRSIIQLNVYDILGKNVASLVNREQFAGTYKIEFNASKLSSGIYFYRLNSFNSNNNEFFTKTRKLLLLK